MQLLQDYDDSWFTKATYENQAMHHLLLTPKSTCYNLRTLCDSMSVNIVKFELHKKTFINRVVVYLFQQRQTKHAVAT